MATDVQIPAVESSPAVVETAPVTSTPSAEPRKVESFNDAERLEWQKTGKVPDPQPPKKEASAASEEISEIAPGSEPGKEAQGKNSRSNAETRVKELLAENKKLKEAAKAAPKTEPKAEPSPAAAAPEPVKALEAPKKPLAKDFEGKPYEEFEAAYDKYVQDLAEYSGKKAVQDFQREQVQQERKKKLDSEMAESRSRYGETYDSVIQPTMTTLLQELKDVPAVTEMIGRSRVFSDLLYVLGENKEQFAEFVKLSKSDPALAIEKVVLMGHGIETELGKGKEAKAKVAETAPAERNESGQFVAKETPPVKTVTDRGKTPIEVGGINTPPADDVADAVKRGNVTDYIARANARDLAHK